MSPIALDFFGTPHIARDGSPVHLPRRKAVAMLAYLAVTQEGQARDVLATLLWPDLSQRRARANLRHALYTANEALGAGWLEATEDEIALPMRPEVRVDVVRFRRMCGEPAAHRHVFPYLCEACIQALTVAANLYRGDFLAGFALPDAPEFDTWQLMQREALQRELSWVLDSLAGAYAEAGRRQYDLAIAYARRRLALDTLHEPAHRTLMRLYAESGDRAAAVRQFEECARLLHEELGVEPEEETLALVSQIREGMARGGESRAPPPAERGAAAELAMLHNLPVQATSFIGREREMAQITRRLADADCRLLTIVGPGGSGKTRLAIQAAAANATSYRDGVRFLDLSPVESAELLATAIERGIDAPELGSADPRRRLSDFLRPKQMLLVLDNLEHLLDGVDLLPELLHAAPELTLLATSRQRLNLREEWLSPLEGLAFPPAPPPGGPDEPEGVPDLAQYDATLLFINRMRKLRPNYVPDSPAALRDQDAVAIAAICRLLEGMPLAIELAAGWTRTLTLQELQHEIERSLAVLSSSLRDVPPRMRSMHAAFDHSWRLLTQDERNIMRQMSVFRGGCTRDAAEKVTGASVAQLSSLVDKSWLRLRAGGRYTVHELARQYCAEKLAALGDDVGDDSPEAVRRRHCAYYGPYVTDLIGTTNYRPGTLSDILDEFGNLRAALRSAIDSYDTQTATSVCWSIFYVGDMMGWQRFSIQTLETYVPVLEQQLADKALAEPMRTEVAHVLAAILHAQVCQYGWLGSYTNARICNERLIRVADEMRPGRKRNFWQALGQGNRAANAYDTGQYEVAYELAKDEMEIYSADRFECLLYGRERGRGFWRSDAFVDLARSAWALGDYAASDEYYAECMRERDSIGEQRFKGIDLGKYADLARTTGDYGRAEELAREGLRLSELYGDRLGTARGHLAVGTTLAAEGRHTAARRHLLKSLETGRQSGNVDLVMRSLCALGRMDLAQGRPADARHAFEDAFAAFRHSRGDAAAADDEAGDPHNALSGIWLGMGWTALAEGDTGAARRMFEKAQGERGVLAAEVQEANAGLAGALLAEGECAGAEALLRAVLAEPATSHATRVLAERMLAEGNS